MGAAAGCCLSINKELKMKISKRARARLKLMTASEKKKITSAARTLFDFGLISTKRAEMIARNYR